MQQWRNHERLATTATTGGEIANNKRKHGRDWGKGEKEYALCSWEDFREAEAVELTACEQWRTT